MTAPAASPETAPPSPAPAPRSQQRVIFIGGLGRSGSTLLDRILGQIDGNWSIGEVVQIWRTLLEDGTRCGCGQPYRECPLWTAIIDAAFGGWDRIDVEAMAAHQLEVDRNRYIPLMIVPWAWPPYRRRMREYAAILDRLYRAIVEVTGAEVVVDSAKHASYAFLLRHVPSVDLRVVHLVRDSRGVAYSWTKVMKRADHEGALDMARFTPREISVRWTAYNLLFNVLRLTRVPIRFLRYEDLIAHPRATVQQVLDLAEVREAGEMAFLTDSTVTFREPTHGIDGNPMRFKSGTLELRQDDEWRQKLPVRQRRLVSVLTAPLMWAYGYRLRSR